MIIASTACFIICLVAPVVGAIGQYLIQKKGE